jgi:hypothetical protein
LLRARHFFAQASPRKQPGGHPDEVRIARRVVGMQALATCFTAGTARYYSIPLKAISTSWRCLV